LSDREDLETIIGQDASEFFDVLDRMDEQLLPSSVVKFLREEAVATPDMMLALSDIFKSLHEMAREMAILLDDEMLADEMLFGELIDGELLPDDYVPGEFMDLPEEAQTPERKAQYMMYEAWDASEVVGQMLAEKALDLWPDCADAWAYLANMSEDLDEAIELYLLGVAAGQRALGQEFFEKNAGHFWGVLDSRPYMRARGGLAIALWEAEEREDAVAHLQDMLELNPNDNQGLRYILMGWLLQMNDIEQAHDLFDKYKKEDSVFWKYTGALLTFLDFGDVAMSNKKLEEAFVNNPYVPQYIIDQRKIPRQKLPHYSPGKDSEAVFYAQECGCVWAEYKAARKWLKKQWQNYNKE